MLTYGDGVCDVNLKDLYDFHKHHNKIATVTAIQMDAKLQEIVLKSEGTLFLVGIE